MNFISVKGPELLNMYVGESEKNIKQAFEEAERTNSILLFDEADSFFADRNNAQHSWERTMVNEFLTQMEEFKGILICTTNLKHIMDSAMQRRFHFCVEFKPLEKSGIQTMLEKYFPEYGFTKDEIKTLEASGSITPGDFGSLSSIEKIPQIVNHFEFHSAISNKTNMFINLFNYCEKNNINIDRL